jgi:pilus assembly protein CpaE
MTDRIRTLVAVDEGVDRNAVEAALPGNGRVEIVGLVDGLDQTWGVLQETPTDLLVVACAGYSDRVLYLVEGSVKQREDRPVVVLSQGSPNGFVARVFEAGAADILTLPQSAEEIAFALEKAVARIQGGGGGAGVATAPMICVLGPKGGTGKTLTTANLAVGLADAGHRVVAVDLDLQFGDLGLALGLAPDKTLYDLAKSGGSLDAEKLDAYLAKHSSGARVLLAPTRPDHAGAVTVEFLRDLYPILRSTSDYLIVDTPPGFTPEVIASIDSSSHICMVGMLDALSLKNTKLGLETLEMMGYAVDRVRLVLNRADTRVGITGDDVVAIIGRAPDISVPSDRDIPRSVNEGMPITLAKPRSDAAKAFRSLAATYVPVTAQAKNGRRRLFGRKA